MYIIYNIFVVIFLVIAALSLWSWIFNYDDGNWASTLISLVATLIVWSMANL